MSKVYSATSLRGKSDRIFLLALEKIIRGEVDYKLMNGTKVNFKNEQIKKS